MREEAKIQFRIGSGKGGRVAVLQKEQRQGSWSREGSVVVLGVEKRS